MFVRNLRDREITVIFRISNANPKKEMVPAGKNISIPALTEISQVIFNSYDQRVRDIKAAFPNNKAEELIEFRLTPGLTGTTI